MTVHVHVQTLFVVCRLKEAAETNPDTAACPSEACSVEQPGESSGSAMSGFPMTTMH